MRYAFYKPNAIYELGRRANQEDAIFPALAEATADDRLFVVCDGMGGLERGEVASNAVVQAIGKYVKENCNSEEVFTDEDFTKLLNAAYDNLDAADKGEGHKMGTTIVFLYFHRGGCLAAHIGDSRIYHMRPSTGEILYRSRDHSLVHQLYEYGEITKEEMMTSPQRNVILRAMQPNQNPRTMADIVHIKDIKPGDYFLICSDGMLERTFDSDIMNILKDANATDEQKRDAFVEFTKDNHDNHSAYIIHVQRVESEELDNAQPDDEAKARAANKALNDDSQAVEVTVVQEDDEESTGQTSFMQDENLVKNINMEPESIKKGTSPAVKITLIVLSVLIVAAIGYNFFLKDKIAEISKKGIGKELVKEVADTGQPAKIAVPVKNQESNTAEDAGVRRETNTQNATPAKAPAAKQQGKPKPVDANRQEQEGNAAPTASAPAPAPESGAKKNSEAHSTIGVIKNTGAGN